VAREIERKFLVNGDGWRAAVTRSSALRQGYLARGDSASIRVRIKDNNSAQITIKSTEAGLSRSEYEYGIPVGDAEELLALCGDRVVEKRRHIVPADDLKWEIDEFGGRHAGLILAEVELDSEARAVALPDWIGDEVTDDPRYRNEALAGVA
jgi:adenylate cyclase